MVVSGDRDVYQLVEDGVRVMTTSRGVTDTKIYDTEGVVERYGVPPELVTDLIGLKGDTSDNIPGVPGIGDKTAAALLQEFGSLEAVLANVDKISGAKRKENLDQPRRRRPASRRSWRPLTLRHRGALDDPRWRAQAGPQPAARGGGEFELRVVVERMEEELGADYIPEGGAERDARRGVRGRGSPTSPRGRWRSRRRAAAGRPPTRRRSSAASSATASELAEAIGDRPLIGHDLKSQGGGGAPPACSPRAAGRLELSHDTMVAAYLSTRRGASMTCSRSPPSAVSPPPRP